MAKQITKVELEKMVTTLEVKLLHAEDEDKRVRQVFSELLESYYYESSNNSFYNNRDKKALDVQSWEGIAFMIGELKADANYAILLERLEVEKKDNLELRAELDPKDKECNEF
jgi:hypothetical protein